MLISAFMQHNDIFFPANGLIFYEVKMNNGNTMLRKAQRIIAEN